MKKILIQYLWIISLFLIVILIAGCVNKPLITKKEPSVYDGSLGLMLGCMFDPKACKEVKKNAEQDEITKEWEEVDKQLDK